ncbi:MAG: family 1 glycosylhydrolase, partial [Fervidobacterium sp.]
MFPEDFLFGASLSGFQFEMGYKTADELDENTDWYVWVHDRENIEKGVVSGDLPEDGPGYWHNYEKVHKLAKDFGMNILRVGIEWSRIFPKSTKGIEFGSDNMLGELDKISNKLALEHYRKIFEDIKNKGMKLFVDLNH